ncbi:hypothetical protein OEZ86_008676 [Tetradesmus obliquus]|nr:hypothetical protein OEZ86_008676 [Tetradesmus obliquus]
MSNTDAELDSLVQDAIVWASQHGLVVGLGGTAPPAALIHAPLSLLPVAFPASRFQQAKAAMTTFNTLIDRVAADEAYLFDTLALAGQQDDFTGRLLQLLQDSKPARAAAAAAGAKEVVLGVHRSDYMLDAPSGGFLQVELNTIASSFACLSSITSQLHHYTLQRLAAASSSSSSEAAAALQLLSASRLPSNAAMQGICRALAAAVVAAGGPGAVMVMVVQPGERNAYDQQWLQHTLWTEHGIATRRLTLAQIPDALQLQPDAAGGSRLVFADNGTQVGLVYFRAGYTPIDYPTDKEWQARALIEASTAAKCPTVAYQLAGSKKVQQDLAAPGVVERFMGQQQGGELRQLFAAPGVVERFMGPQQGGKLRQLFAGLWSLDNISEPATAAVIQDAIQNPDRFVLKPQREGGGNNLYGPELSAALQQGLAAGGDSLAAFILMQRIVPPPQRSVFVRGGAWAEDESLSELGIYGTFLRIGDEVMINEEVGHLVRTKTSSSNEGGVAAGFAVLDSPMLSEPGEGLLPPQLDGSSSSTAAAAAAAVSWGESGGALAAARALLQQQQQQQ